MVGNTWEVEEAEGEGVRWASDDEKHRYYMGMARHLATLEAAKAWRRQNAAYTRKTGQIRPTKENQLEQLPWDREYDRSRGSGYGELGELSADNDSGGLDDSQSEGPAFD